MLKQVRKYQHRIAWVSLAALLLFAVGPYGLVPMTVWMGSSDCDHETCTPEATLAQTPADAHHGSDEHDHSAVDHHQVADAHPSTGDGVIATSGDSHPECPPSSPHCCGAMTCGLSAILPDVALLTVSISSVQVFSPPDSGGRLSALISIRPPVA